MTLRKKLFSLGVLGVLVIGAIFLLTNNRRRILDNYCSALTKIDAEEHDPALRAAKRSEYFEKHVSDPEIQRIFQAAAGVDPSIHSALLHQGIRDNLGLKGWNCPAL